MNDLLILIHPKVARLLYVEVCCTDNTYPIAKYAISKCLTLRQLIAYDQWDTPEAMAQHITKVCNTMPASTCPENYNKAVEKIDAFLTRFDKLIHL